MSSIKIPQENHNSENFVGATDNSQLPDNSMVAVDHSFPRISSDELLGYEKERKCLFRIAFVFTLITILVLYVGLGFWIFGQRTEYYIHSNMWHIAVILAIPPTTLLFLLLKVLAKQSVEQVGNYPASEFLGQIINILKEWLNKK